jgi:hypothetical protein
MVCLKQYRQQPLAVLLDQRDAGVERYCYFNTASHSLFINCKAPS